MDGWVRVLRPFNSTSVISRRWEGEHDERLCAMKRRLGSGRISPPAGFEPATPWFAVGSANCSATRTFHLLPEEVCDVWLWRSFSLFFVSTACEPRHDKTNKMIVRPTKTQISLGIRPVWSESSLSAWRKLGSLATHLAHSEDSDQTGRMPRLIWVFYGRTLIFLVLSCRGSWLLYLF